MKRLILFSIVFFGVSVIASDAVVRCYPIKSIWGEVIGWECQDEGYRGGCNAKKTHNDNR